MPAIRSRHWPSSSICWLHRRLLNAHIALRLQPKIATHPSSLVVSIEQHVDWISNCLAHMEAKGYASIESGRDAEDRWVEHGNEAANRTLYPRAASWYMGANVPGKPRVFMPYIGGVGVYRDICERVAAKGYEGFSFTSKSHEHRHGPPLDAEVTPALSDSDVNTFTV